MLRIFPLGRPEPSSLALFLAGIVRKSDRREIRHLASHGAIRPDGSFGRRINGLKAVRQSLDRRESLSHRPGSHDENDERERRRACSIRANN